jgi:hypothetical protein
MSERVHSVETLRAGFSELLSEYMQHIEPTATTEVTAIRCEAVGENLSVFIDLAPNAAPYMQITLQRRDANNEPVEPGRGRTLFGGNR